MAESLRIVVYAQGSLGTIEERGPGSDEAVVEPVGFSRLGTRAPESGEAENGEGRERAGGARVRRAGPGGIHPPFELNKLSVFRT